MKEIFGIDFTHMEYGHIRAAHSGVNVFADEKAALEFAKDFADKKAERIRQNLVMQGYEAWSKDVHRTSDKKRAIERIEWKEMSESRFVVRHEIAARVVRHYLVEEED